MAPAFWGWVLFNASILALLILDLKVFHRRDRAITLKEALGWSAFWIFLALAFNAGVWWKMGKGPALEFLTGYLIEKSLSVDNLFVFWALFRQLRVPERHQHKVLFWGILGALGMRIAFIFAGVAMLRRFHWMVFLLGAFLLWTGIRLALEKTHDPRPHGNFIVAMLQRFLPIYAGPNEDGRFFMARQGRRMVTMLFVTLVMVEVTDVIFAMDSIPAILAISRNTFIIYTSNVFAILGLRSLFFAVSGLIGMFRFLRHALSLILVFVGLKMLAADVYHVPIAVSLLFVAGTLTLAIAASWLHPEKRAAGSPPEG